MTNPMWFREWDGELLMQEKGGGSKLNGPCEKARALGYVDEFGGRQQTAWSSGETTGHKAKRTATIEKMDQRSRR